MPLSACIKSATHTVCFFNVGLLLISLFSELVMLWSLVAITRQTQNPLTTFDQLPIRVHYPTGFCLAIARSSV